MRFGDSRGRPADGARSGRVVEPGLTCGRPADGARSGRVVEPGLTCGRPADGARSGRVVEPGLTSDILRVAWLAPPSRLLTRGQALRPVALSQTGPGTVAGIADRSLKPGVNRSQARRSIERGNRLGFAVTCLCTPPCSNP
jgi:hypothetical protein